MDDNVISFRRSDDDAMALPNTALEAKKNLEAIRHVYLNEVTEQLVSTIVQQMMVGGFNILSDGHEKDFAFMIETVRSCLCKTVNLYHPFQDVSEEIMKDHGDGVYLIADSISVKFQDEKSDDERDDEPVSEVSP